MNNISMCSLIVIRPMTRLRPWTRDSREQLHAYTHRCRENTERGKEAGRRPEQFIKLNINIIMKQPRTCMHATYTGFTCMHVNVSNSAFAFEHAHAQR
jgi:hypothetical protein